MAKKKIKEERYIPRKNYIYTACIVIAVLLIAWYIVAWYNVKQKEKYMNSYLLSTNTLTYEITEIEAIEQVFKEAPSKYFVYISFEEDGDVYQLEKKLKKIIDTYGIQNETYYINITELKDDPDIYDDLNNAFNTKKITNAPCILYYVNKELTEVIIEKDKIFDAADFEKLLKNNGFEKII